MAVLLFIAGLLLLYAGGELIMRGAVALARRVGLSPLLVGLAVVALATSAPELSVSLMAVFSDAPDLAVGTVIGSSIANILLVLALGALVAPVAGSRVTVFRDGLVALAATGLLFYFVAQGEITQSAGGLLLGGLAVYLVIAYVSERLRPTPAGPADLEDALEGETGLGMRLALGAVLAGMLALALGSGLLIDGSIQISEMLGVPERVVALSMIAIGTSLPELATILIAAFRRHAEVAVGAILGSIIFNSLGILGVTALLRPILVSKDFIDLDLPVLAGANLVLILLMTFRLELGRLAAAGLLLGYAAYLVALYQGWILPFMLAF